MAPEILGRSCHFRILQVSSLLLLCLSHGFGSKVMETVEHGDSSTVQVEETVVKSREMIEVMDYPDPGANTNPKTGHLFSPPPRA
ncbi:hypothetical protein I3843_04G015900 [Carya illinoinensis]|uniref:Uncharacterized protein n=1 Tax=Carya illinoinensis TaxID=32201 RepID=A0A8T1QQG7_CARIL|nr:uncharacterized protein LOC122307666 [Carya illinoinensis]KAG2710211.1 hypothetical protein I3760_04G016000 [Carya illinoinensis]KAG6656344.1 hypothetical protein CIPAW_04G016300 [Carya illinoinensis]KAG6715842.1 hypothetical protein I3842_04G016500 [Carya illinoinensis]KAG7981795.1 hypothetical protein I3843_04G015900 [Carya illinoinensis]